MREVDTLGVVGGFGKMEISLQELQKNAGILFSRENPFYAAFKDTWRRSLAAYGGGSG